MNCRFGLKKDNVTSTTVKAHTEKKDKKKAQRKDSSVLKENKKILLQNSETFMKYFQEIKNKSDIFNSDVWDIELDKDDFEILMIRTRTLSRTFDEIIQIISTNSVE